MVQEGLVVRQHDGGPGQVQRQIWTILTEPDFPKFKILLEQCLSKLLPLPLAQVRVGKTRASIVLCPGIVLRVTVGHLAGQAVVAHHAQRQRTVAVRAIQLRKIVPVQLAIAFIRVVGKDLEILPSQSTHILLPVSRPIT